MDTFFATKKVDTTTRILLKSKGEVLLEVKKIAKEVGAPDAFIRDAAGEQTSHPVRAFCAEILTMLRVLEKETPWANKAELYIGLIKETVLKDIKESNCPLLCGITVLSKERESKISQQRIPLSSMAPPLIQSLKKMSFPFNKEVLGHVLGPTKGEGNEMTQ
eukprot:15366755-Ditylum_brightwellii.AAC.2